MTMLYRIQANADVEVLYREARPREAPAILLLRGYPAAGRMFRDLAPRLAALRHSRAAAALLFISTVAVMALAGAAHAQDDEIAEGQMLYESKCGGCHSLDANRVGPRHHGVIGRLVASLKDYDYSPAIKKLGGVWTPARIDQWLLGPQIMAPGSKMFFQVSDPAQRKSIIAYLAANSPSSK